MEAAHDIQTQLEKAVPAIPTDNKKSLFVLLYRQKNNPYPMIKNFFHPGDFRSAIQRGKRHCDDTGLVFIMVKPFVSDLDDEEKRHRGEI
jgi:hypothetical protein